MRNLLNVLSAAALFLTTFCANNRCVWIIYQEEVPKCAMKLKR